MTTESYSKHIDAIDNQPSKAMLLLLIKDLITKTETIKQPSAQINELENEVTDSEERMLEQEKFSSC